MEDSSMCPGSVRSLPLLGFTISLISLHVPRLDSDVFLPRTNPYQVALSVTLAGVFLLILLASYCFWKQHRGKDAQQAELKEKIPMVILDPDTAHPSLLVSENRRSVKWRGLQQDVPDNPERFDSETCVLGLEGFTSGQHYWEGGEDILLEKDSSGILPNGDSTYCTQSSLEMSPQQEEGHCYSCQVEHSSLPEPALIWGLHSRRIFHTVVSEPGPGLPWYRFVAYMDDQVVFDYSSGMQRVEPRTVWMAQNEGPEFWDHQIFWARRWEAWFRASLNTLRELYNRTEGFHIIQMIRGCDLREDNVIQGFHQDSYDGRDFLTFDKETMTWVAADIGAQITKRRWDTEIGDNHYWKRYLEEDCIPWLRSSLEYGKETLQRKEPNNSLIPTVAGVITAVVLIGVIIGVVVWKKKRSGRKGDGYAVPQGK
ncbi:hypothetical protein KIL84_001426 [Mauremys mutica]|uniref:B30.2/SPRY domain-containing protein n=1 Tax=Mauremys mutica TaxID=74926 RepID=A0A9D3X093_9SAUR|nr:hypothetical protein KIL84_001426 [Mauremys mutica]